jgi:hypothetical protein
VIVKYSSPNAIVVIVAVLLLAAVVWAINRSKRPTQEISPETVAGD